MTEAAFRAVDACWICGGRRLERVHEALLELSIYRDQDPELADYSNHRVWMTQCADCGFGQPDRLPALPRFFDRMYDQRWSRDWVEREFISDSKSAIFERVLSGLERRLPAGRRDLVDVGAHVGKFVHMARGRGWRAEGVELNPATASYARQRTGAAIHGHELSTVAATVPARFDALTLTDVLEHIPEPLDTLRAAAEVIRPGGWIAVKVPCGPNQLLKERLRVRLGRADRLSVADNLVHVNHFTVQSLRMALERAGFDRIEIEPGVPERNENPAIWRRAAANMIRRGAWHVARALPLGSPLAFNLQAFGRRRESAA